MLRDKHFARRAFDVRPREAQSHSHRKAERGQDRAGRYRHIGGKRPLLVNAELDLAQVEGGAEDSGGTVGNRARVCV